ncbi:acyl-CoA dehydrogenase family protein [Dinghuibacter silviterrae]|uniref:Alkylation response protein AidB-like acyl-CoA dehydrogenase n=1 Tax=Dinghuibacter silviterrae TaxID=1539049 RepID=A0A4R8DFJ0_9BACT|nr:acyl-CoA dehydrogenase [Dinghuibacter silviterrae]TDW95700.1 alkylation response protein AidB-like acyl-CoA dehydrogenase [Dinghuibacter silviterrae]
MRTPVAPDVTAVLPGDLLARIRSEAGPSEALGRLTPAAVALLVEQGWLRLLIPRSVGGLEYDLPDLLALQEAASWADGSFGWVLALCGGAGFFAGFIEQALAVSLFGRPDVCAAGTGFPAGSATEVAGGYLVSGHWRYASGAPHATLYTANCRLMRDGQPLRDERGEPLIRAVIFLPDQVTLQDGWQSLGLKATASQDMVVREAFVPFNRSFALDKPFPHASGPLYAYPFLQQAEAVLSVTMLGMVRHFLDLFGVVDGAPDLAGELEQMRQRFYATIRASWASPGGPVPLTEVGKVARAAAATALRVADTLYPYGGMRMMRMGTDINRVWRDIHTASQHTLLSPLRD